MADQMTPDAMREAAKRLREEAAGFAEVNPADNVIPALAAGADALDRLADPVSLGRIAWEAVHDHGAFARDFPDEAYYRAVGEAIARGEVRDVS